MQMKISGLQVFWIITVMEMGEGTLFIVSSTIAESKQDAWMSILISGAFSILVTFLASKLSTFFPNQTLVEYSQTILGKWIGKIALIPYFLYWYTALGIVFRQFAEVVQMVLLPRTSMLMIVLLMMFTVVYATTQGIETIGRTSEVIGPISVIMLVVLFLLIVPDVNLQNLRPFYMTNGWSLVLKGSLPSVHFFSEGYLIMMLVKFMQNPKIAPVRSVWAVGVSCLVATFATVLVLSVFGPTAAKMWYPFFTLVEYISVLGFIKGIEPVVLVVWLLSVFVKLSLYFFVASYGTAQALGVTSWKKMIWFVTPVVLVLAMLPRNIDESSVLYPEKFALPFMFPVCDLLLPTLLLIVGFMRKKSLNTRVPVSSN